MQDSQKIVETFLQALNNEDFISAREQLSDDMKFEGVLGSRDGADPYMSDMQKMKFKYTIKKIISEGDDVSVLYDISMSGINVVCCGWYRLEKGKINYFRVVFDPREVLKAKK